MLENKTDNLIKYINSYHGEQLKLMEVCGTHTMSVFKHGIRNLLPESIKLISGPGCPVCVTPQSYIDNIVEIAKNGAIIVTFGDTVRVPGTDTSLEHIRALGADIRVVYSPLDALKISMDNPGRNVVFAAVGFETTTPVIALAVKKAKELNIRNLFFLCGMKLMIPALEMLCEDRDIQIDGFLLPGHVSAVVGESYYDYIALKYNKPCVIAGFEAYDIFLSLSLLLKQILIKEHKIENAYERVVKREGNKKAYACMLEVFEPADSLWRGIGTIKNSGLKLRPEYKCFDAAVIYDLKGDYENKASGCICGNIIKGINNPNECSMFGKLCTPLNPIGACMVSSEGTCAAYYKYK